ncbi:MAG: phenylalanine--tRNA ligase subunit beta [Candidatus Portnoybacteria bacterium]|nr:phenylalanine--tRNA ligase subunit beta [Candidatus Portnoybacteria bacterium]
MKISYNWLQSLIKKKLPQPEKLADLLTRHSFEVELVEKRDDDHLLDVEVLPNRAHDCLSHLGIAREIAAITNNKLQITNYNKIQNSKFKIQNLVKVENKDKNLCPRYTARALINVKVGPSPQWLQERLEVCGLRPISNIVDIANYVMLETGQPLHAFDADKLKSQGKTKTIIVRRAKKGEKITTLDNEKYDLDENILVIADEKNPVCVAGIKGGQGPGIDGQTKRIILEAANFSPQIIRQGSQQLNLKTDASWRFEHQLDPNLTEEAVALAAYLVQEIAGGEILDGIVDVYPIKIKPKKVKLDIKRVKSLLGVDIPAKEIKSILERLGFEVQPQEVIVPTRRLDVSIPEDLIEEIGRLYGFEKIPSQMPRASLIPPKRNEDLIYQNKIRDILTNLGFSEVYNYSFVSDKGVEVLNPISQEQKYLRPNLAINLIKNIKENKKYFNEVRLFEIGKVFEKNKSQVIEKKKLGAVLFPADFYRLKGVIETLLNKLRITDVWYDEATGKNIRAKVKTGNDLLGWLGDNIFELDFEKIVKLATEERIYAAPSKYPAVVRDVALLVERGTKVIEALNLIHAAGGPLIRDIDLFDIYDGEEIPDGKKNLAFHIIYQSDDHTLTDKEVNKLQEKIIKALEEEGGWEVRK